MANIYTKPVQSQFVPTYQPINLDAVNIGAQAMQKRQDANFAKMDEIQEQMANLEKQTFEQDRPLIQERSQEIRKNLEELAADGDLSDANRQIRSLANQFREEITSGKSAKALKNFKTVQDRYAEIDESDLSDAQKTARKNAIIAGYKGVEEGGLDMSINTDDIDFNQWVDDNIGDIRESKMVQETGWNWNSQLGKWEKGNITKKGVPQEVLQAVVSSSLSNDPRAMSALRQRARVATAGEDEFVIGEGDDARIVSRDEKMKQLIESQTKSLYELAARKHGGQDLEVTTETSTPSKYSDFAGTGFSMTATKRGITNAREVGITGFDQATGEIAGAVATGNDTEATELSSSLQMALDSFRNEDEDITDEDIQFMREVGAQVASTKSDYSPAMLASGEGAGRFSDPVGRAQIESLRSKIGGERIDKYNRLKNKFDDWVQKGGGWTDKEIILDDSSAGRTAHDNIQKMISKSTGPNDWKIYGSEDADSRELLSSPAGEDADNSVWDTFEFGAVVPGNDHAPTMVSGWVTQDGERKKVRLVEKRDPTLPDHMNDVTDSILETLGGQGEEIKKNRRFEHLAPTSVMTDVSTELPASTRSKAVNDFVGMKRSKDGYQVSFGTDGNIKDFTQGMFINNIHKFSAESNLNAREVIEQLNDGTLTEDEIGTILDGEMNDDIKRKLKYHFTEPYSFRNKRVAAEAGATTR